MMREENTFVFVYGTLKNGQRKCYEMGDAQFVRAAFTAAAQFTMREYDSTSSPGSTTPAVSDDGNNQIAGEVYAVTLERLHHLDIFEQVGVHYRRELVTLDDGRQAWIYLHNLQHSNKVPRAATKYITPTAQGLVWAETPSPQP
jgi:gamma-glutamylcyclotransferase (GGCT)/AIG2-like uncharacterized protein YtfP